MSNNKYVKISSEKNFENLIKAIKICNIKNNKIRLYIIGKGRERKNLQKLRNKYNLRKIVIGNNAKI